MPYPKLANTSSPMEATTLKSIELDLCSIDITVSSTTIASHQHHIDIKLTFTAIYLLLCVFYHATPSQVRLQAYTPGSARSVDAPSRCPD